MSSSQRSVDLTNCDREPIHIPGSIQPHGALLAFDVSLVVALRHSRNAPELLGLEGEINGQAAELLLGDELTHRLRNALGTSGDSSRPALLFDQSMPAGGRFDIAIHRHLSSVIVEFEPAAASNDQPLQLTRTMIDRISRIESVDQLVQTGARLVRGVLGYDRVMIYRFEPDGAGKVMAEVKRADLESFLGQYFPASDIPQQARALYLKNTIRIISSASYQPIPLVPQFDLSGEPLDLSFAHLRSVSPIHLEYLRNMGVGASMSISIIVDGELWGLIACHHYSPRTLPMGLRVAAEMFGEFFSLHLNALRQKQKLNVATEARHYLDRVLKLASQRPLEEVLLENLGDFGRLIPNDGFALFLDGHWHASGTTPSDTDAPALVEFIGAMAHGRVWATHSLATHFPGAENYYQLASGVLAIPLSQLPRDYLLFFRRELVQTLNWAGNPEKSYETGPLGDRLTPRKSFAIWKQAVHRQAQPWTEAEREIAEAARASLVEVVLRHNEMLEEERAKADVRQRVLNEELNHRVKNILSVIKSLVGQPVQQGRSLQQYVGSLKGRIQALSFAHDQVIRGDGGGLLSHLVNAELTPYRGGHTTFRVRDDGVWLDSRAYSVMALVLHELATNAAKYGSLSVAGGQLSVDARLAANGDCIIEWEERGGPPVAPPSREGFGTALLDRSVPFDLGGESDIVYAPEGLHARFRLPARHVRHEGGEVSAKPSLPRLATGEASPPSDLAILLVEDQLLIAMDAESMLADRGFTAVTGYGDQGVIPPEYSEVPVVRKPYDAQSLVSALSKVLAKVGTT